MQTGSIIFISLLLSLLFLILITLIILEILFEQGKFKNRKPIKENTNIQDVFDIIENSISNNKNKYTLDSEIDSKTETSKPGQDKLEETQK